MHKPLNLADDAPWRQRFTTPTIATSSIATLNPQRGLIVANLDGQYQLYAWDVPTGDLFRVTDAPAGVVRGVISADGEVIYYLFAEQGDDIGHLFRVPFSGGTPEDLTPGFPAYASLYFSESYSGRFYGFVAVNQEGFQVFVVDNASGGRPHLRTQTEVFSVGPILSYDGEISVIATTEHGDGNTFSLEAYDTLSGERIQLLQDVDASIFPVGFATRPADMRLVALSNHTGQQRPLIWNTRTGERRDIALDLDGDVEVWDWSSDGVRLLIRHTAQARDALYQYDLKTNTLHRVPTPAGSFGTANGYYLKDGRIALHWQDAVTPTRLLAIDLTNGATSTLLSISTPPAGQAWSEIHATAPDGTEVQAWLATPESNGPHPLIVHVHGGPSDVQVEAYSPESQAWLDHGFAFLSVNYRGSTSFGTDYADALKGHIGQREVDDVIACVEALITQKIARPEAIFITGGAYGGFITLQALSRYPQIFAGGMAISPLTDWSQTYTEAESLRDYQRDLFGGTPDTHATAYRDASPVHHVASIEAPVLIMHDRDDQRLPTAPIDAYLNQLAFHGKRYDVIWQTINARDTAARIDRQQALMTWVYQQLELSS